MRSFIAYNGSAPTGIAPVQAFPTTAAQWTIWNADSLKSFNIQSLGAILFSGTNAVGGTLLATIFSAPVQSANSTGLTVMSGTGNTSHVSNAFIHASITITTPASPVWAPVADASLSAIATLPSTTIINRNISGSIIIPPGFGLGLAVLAPAGTSQLFVPIAEWIESEAAHIRKATQA